MEDSEKLLDFPNCHKTIFILDHTPYFGISCDRHVEFGVSRVRPGMIPPKPISKSLWTCSVEAAVEYSRIVWDLFPEGRLVRFVVSDDQGKLLNSWNEDDQNIYRILGCLSACGVPPRLNASNVTVDYSIVHGFRITLESLCEYTPEQIEARTILRKSNLVPNNVRVICITSTRDDESITNLENIFLDELENVNKSVEGSKELLAITHCHLLIINTYPNSLNPTVNGHTPVNMSSTLTTEVMKIPAFNTLATKLLHLLLKHYDLASTIITGIPMKEELNSNSSANYDVEIYHETDVHVPLLLGNSADLGQILSLKEDGDYETITLNWSTPRGNGELHEFDSCNTLHRITPVDTNSRPSACLITFLLNGRTVMLDSPAVENGRVVTHLLTSYAGELFIQNVDTTSDLYAEQPSLYDIPEKEADDYRTDDFGELMEVNSLLPLEEKYQEEEKEGGMYAARSMLLDEVMDRFAAETKVWPLTMSSNVIFNAKEHIEPLLTILRKPELTREDIVTCKLCIYKLADMDRCRKVPFPGRWMLKSGNTANIVTRNEQYRLMWSEIAAYINAHNVTPNHRSVLTGLQTCLESTPPEILEDKAELEKTLREIEHDKEQLSKRDTVIKATTDSPMSPPSSAPPPPPIRKVVSKKNRSPTLSSEAILTVCSEGLGLQWYKKSPYYDMGYVPPYRGMTHFQETPEGGFFARTYPHLPESDSSDED